MKYLSKLTLFPAIAMIVLASLIVRTGVASAAPATKCKHWKIISSPDPESNNLSGVAGLPGAKQVWAVGVFTDSSGAYQNLVESNC
jgi:hypothetical protein